MEHERINARAKLRDDKRYLVGHEARNKMNVTAQPIELSDRNGAFLPAVRLESSMASLAFHRPRRHEPRFAAREIFF
jgi:hypothetical protein